MTPLKIGTIKVTEPKGGSVSMIKNLTVLHGELPMRWVTITELVEQFPRCSDGWLRAKRNLETAISHPDYSYRPSSRRNYTLLMNLMRFGMTQLSIYNNQQHYNRKAYLP